MKKDIHPNYRPVVFSDDSAKFSFLTRSTVQTRDTIVWKDGKEIKSERTDPNTDDQSLIVYISKLINFEKLL